MKHLLLAFAIGFIAVGCRNFEKGEPDTLQEDIYEGLFEQESFCGNLLRVTKINDELPTNFELTSIKIINQPIDFQKNFQNNTLKLTLKNLKKVELKRCGGFLGYTYEAEIKKIINIKNQ